jgi:putative endonuclease
MSPEPPGDWRRPAAPKERSARGRSAERLAERHLVSRGWRILARNVRRRGGELDLVALDGDEVVFVEVRARRRGSLFDPAATITPAKWRRLARMADRWLGEHELGNAACRFDVIAVLIDGRGAHLRHIRGAFVDEGV